MAVAIALTWATNVLEIISLASRTFALYYALQCLVAILVATRTSESRGRRATRIAAYALLFVACAAITLFGIPAG
jgi:hypothetical protein